MRSDTSIEADDKDVENKLKKITQPFVNVYFSITNQMINKLSSYILCALCSTHTVLHILSH